MGVLVTPRRFCAKKAVFGDFPEARWQSLGESNPSLQVENLAS